MEALAKAVGWIPWTSWRTACWANAMKGRHLPQAIASYRQALKPIPARP